MPQRAERDDQGLFKVDYQTLDQRAYRKRFKALLDPLNLLKVVDFEENDQDGLGVNQYRPLTPIQDAIKQPPTDLELFSSFVRERLRIMDENFITRREQKALVDILLAELRSIWPDIRKQPPDPFLSPDENKEMYRQVAVEIVTRMSNMFIKHKHMARELKAKGVFSSRANISRLKSQLSEEAGKELNILKVRRKVLNDISVTARTAATSYDKDIELIKRFTFGDHLTRPGKYFKTVNHASRFYRVVQTTELKRLLNGVGVNNKNKKTLFREVEENLKAERPTVGLTEESTDSSTELIESDDSSDEEEILSERDSDASGKSTSKSPDSSKKQFKKSMSCVNFYPKEDIFEDFNLNEVRNMRKISIHQMKSLHENKAEAAETKRNLEDYLKTDLEHLMRLDKNDDEGDNEDIPMDDLPPLLQVYKKPRRKLQKERPAARKEDLDHLELESLNMESRPDEADVILAPISNKMVARTYNVRVSSRFFRSPLTVQSYPVMYNEFKGEVDESMVKQLDSHLFAGDELSEVYDDILGSITKSHFEFDKDNYVEKCMEPTTSLEHAILDLQRMQVSKVSAMDQCPVYQPRGSIDIAGPFGSKPNKKKSYLFQADRKKMVTGASARTYTSLSSWWRTAITTEDYYNYLTLQDTDFLGDIFRLSELMENEAFEGRKINDSNQKKDNEKPTLSAAMMEKSKYVEGFWNPNAVLMGGLGKDPDIANVLTGEAPDPSTGLLDVQQSKRGNSAGRSEVPLSSDLRGGSARAQPNAQMTKSCEPIIPKEEPPTIQSRLDKIWSLLRMTESDRIDMALKYSSDEHLETLPKLVKKLEDVTCLVLSRESHLAELEKFERTASDPNRFFEKGERGKSSARQEEEVIRKSLHKKLLSLERDLRHQISRIRKYYEVDVKFEGHSYLQKMENDKVQMLFWLQQERRKETLVSANGNKKQITSVQLPSVTM